MRAIYLTLGYFLTLSTNLSAQKYVLRPDSEITFKVKHLGLINVNGRFKEFSGYMQLTDSLLTGEGTITVKSIDTGNKTRDKELKSPGFLDPEKFPEITYQSGRSYAENGESQIEGRLTIKDQTRTLAFPYDLTKTARGILIEFETTIRRTDFNLEFDSMDGLVGDEVILMGYLLFEREA